MESRILKERETGKDQLVCPLCEKQFRNPDAMISHTRSKEHRDNLQEFLES